MEVAMKGDMRYGISKFFQKTTVTYLNNPELEDKIYRHRFTSIMEGGFQFLHSNIEISQGLRDRTEAILGVEKFEQLDNILKFLLFLSNHDYTMHQMGLVGNGETYKSIAKLLEVKKDTDSGVLTDEVITVPELEVLSANFHRILFERICDQSPQLKRFVMSQVKNYLRIVSRLPLELQDKWVRILKYPYFSLVNPRSKEHEELVMMGNLGSKLRPVKEIKEWSDYVHKDYFAINTDDPRVRDELPTMGVLNYKIRTEDLFDAVYLKAELGKFNVREIIEKAVPF
jgi:hypothetical protein